jgi:cold shock CspA family protein
VLTQGGVAAVQPGETLEVRVGPGHKGPHVTEVLSVDSSTAVPRASQPSNFRAATSDGPSTDTAVEETGTVKWYNAQRGYGFIALANGGKDVFVHVSALERSGLTGPQRGAIRLRRCGRGPEGSRSDEGTIGVVVESTLVLPIRVEYLQVMWARPASSVCPSRGTKRARENAAAVNISIHFTKQIIPIARALSWLSNCCSA